MGTLPPGPICASRLGSTWIDSGTLCRARSPVPGTVGRDPSANAGRISAVQLALYGARALVPGASPLLSKGAAAAASRELDIIGKMKHGTEQGGEIERGLLVRGLKGKYVIRAEANAAAGPGDFFNGPFDTLDQARAAARDLAASGEDAIRRGSALAREWKKGGSSPVEVVRVYRINEEIPGIQSVTRSQPEGGKVMVRPEHYEALRQGKPELANEYRGGNNQLELPVKIMREDYNNPQVVTKVSGAEYRVSTPPAGK